MPTLFAEADPPSWAWIMNQGLAIAIIFAIGMAAWRAIDWAAANLFVPMRDAAIGHLRDFQLTMREVCKTLSDQHESIKELREKITEADEKKHAAILQLHVKMEAFDAKLQALTDSDRARG